MKFEKSIAFSMLELVISLLIVAAITSTAAPIFLKKMETINKKSIVNSMTSNNSSADGCKIWFKQKDGIKRCLFCKGHCAKNQYQDKKDCSCKNCANSTFTNECILCNSNHCTACNSGVGLFIGQNYGTVGKCSGTPCPLGNSTTLTSCHGICNKGWFSDGTRPCQKCEINKYQPNLRQSSCLICPNNSTTKNKIGRIRAGECICNAGYYRISENSTDVPSNPACKECDPGYYCPEVTNPEDDIPNRGKTKLACPINTYQPWKKKTQPEDCLACPSNSTTKGRNARINANECICNGGYYRITAALNSNKGQCLNCGKGYYCPDSNTPDSDVGEGDDKRRRFCKAPYYCPGTNNTAQTSCPDNASTHKNGAKYKTDCICNPGYYGPNGGPCKPCEPGWYCPGGQYKYPCQDDYYASGAVKCSNHSCACLPCSTEGNGLHCIRCYGGSRSCTKCADGYLLTSNEEAVIKNVCFRHPTQHDCETWGGNNLWGYLNYGDGLCLARKNSVSTTATWLAHVNSSVTNHCQGNSKCAFHAGDNSQDLLKTGLEGHCTLEGWTEYSGCARTVVTSDAALQACDHGNTERTIKDFPTSNEIQQAAFDVNNKFNFCFDDEAPNTHSTSSYHKWPYCPSKKQGCKFNTGGESIGKQNYMGCHPGWIPIRNSWAEGGFNVVAFLEENQGVGLLFNANSPISSNAALGYFQNQLGDKIPPPVTVHARCVIRWVYDKNY